MLTLIVLVSCGLLLLIIVAWWYLGRGLDRYDFSGRPHREQEDGPKRPDKPTPRHRRETKEAERHG